jgi:hypothetical protein
MAVAAAVMAAAPVPVALVPAIPPSVAVMAAAVTAVNAPVIAVAAVIGRIAVMMDASGQKCRQGKKRQDRG